MRPNLYSLLFLIYLLPRSPIPLVLLSSNAAALAAFANPLPLDGQTQQNPLSPPKNDNDNTNIKPEKQGSGVLVPFFASLERMARLVDIAYCVGTSGISKPFSCASRCREFPTLRLVRTWNTGILMSDSCGYIAVDHGRSENGAVGAGQDREGPAIIVAFRGTYSITNTIVDLSTVPQEYVPYPDEGGKNKCGNCTVHMGFLASWRSAREVVLPAVKGAREKYPGYPVYLVGHSLGGAVAALAALEMRMSLGWRDVKVTTFGEPRLGNGALVRYLDEAFGLVGEGGEESGGGGEGLMYRRVTHVNDPVPLLPLSEWGFRSHAGEVYIAKTDLPPNPEDLRVCVGDHDPECSGGDENGGDGDWLSGLLGRRRGSNSDEAEAGVVLDDVGEDEEGEGEGEEGPSRVNIRGFPTRLKLWQLFFAHRDYFWRLGLCVPGGDPADWGRGRYNMSTTASGSWDRLFDL